MNEGRTEYSGRPSSDTVLASASWGRAVSVEMRNFWSRSLICDPRDISRVRSSVPWTSAFLNVTLTERSGTTCQ